MPTAYTKSIKHTFAANEREQNFPYYGNFLSIIDLPGAVTIRLQDGESLDLLQGFKLNLAANQEFETLRLSRTDEDVSKPLAIWFVVGWEPRTGETKPLFEDNRAIFNFNDLALTFINEYEKTQRIWTRHAPRVAGGVEAPHLGLTHAAGMGDIIQIAAENPNVIERRIRPSLQYPMDAEGWGSGVPLYFDIYLADPTDTDPLIDPLVAVRNPDWVENIAPAYGLNAWTKKSIQDIVIKGGSALLVVESRPGF